jgi:hypothetical protein
MYALEAAQIPLAVPTMDTQSLAPHQPLSACAQQTQPLFQHSAPALQALSASQTQPPLLDGAAIRVVQTIIAWLAYLPPALPSPLHLFTQIRPQPACVAMDIP